MNHFLFLFLFLGLSRSLFSLSVPSSSSPPFSFVNLTSHSSFRVPGDVGLFDRLRSFECLFCVDFVQNLQLALENVIGQKEIDLVDKIATYICNHLNRVDMGEDVDHTVCRGMVDEFTPQVFYIFFQSYLGARNICEFLDACPPSPAWTWNITFPDTPKPPINPPAPPPAGAPRYNILHITDIHLDLEYQPGATVDCGEPVCCRLDNDLAVNESTAGGFWGDYRNCDTPRWTLESLLHYAREYYADKGGIDLIVYTGDTPAHIVWLTSPEGNSHMMNYTYQMIHSFFPDSKFYGSLGNHEPSPVDLDPPPGIYTGNPPNDVQWLYDAAADIWAENLDPEAQQYLRMNGFYSQRVTDNLVMISLNMNFGDSGNWWLIIDPVDPASMLQWLAYQLQAAEDNGDKVMLIGHQIPCDSLPSFSRVYYDLMLRYESTVVGQFFGHYHTYNMKVFLDPTNTSRGFGSLFVGGSVTTYSNLNVGFAVYEMDQETHQMFDAYGHYFNLTEANRKASPNPDWKFEFSAKEAYNISGPTITSQDWADVSVRMETNDVVWNNYATYQVKSAPRAPCEGSCRTGGICSMRTGYSGGSDVFCSDISQEEMKAWKLSQPKYC
eukprot:CAMPEP_0201489150 /NCGR_PEP_ID=MMETSP0151_2-20130828/21050_1 /ASSEMBLY_ACC=CAM_ASM_000257 /TAXON_ID=200890 /ORGANISM="Paramoeba atlantica, Strain 621/1 / CCAP 1560/9" /LENGTH=607 /DNA_ID=CAMNT_0047874637 /DNA_START=62 /DNA_END=1885 /DNA_ORIENTATION=+